MTLMQLLHIIFHRGKEQKSHSINTTWALYWHRARGGHCVRERQVLSVDWGSNRLVDCWFTQCSKICHFIWISIHFPQEDSGIQRKVRGGVGDCQSLFRKWQNHPPLHMDRGEEKLWYSIAAFINSFVRRAKIILHQLHWSQKDLWENLYGAVGKTLCVFLWLTIFKSFKFILA